MITEQYCFRIIVKTVTVTKLIEYGRINDFENYRLNEVNLVENKKRNRIVTAVKILDKGSVVKE